MSKKEKLIKRLKSRPRDFTYSELVQLLNLLGYKEQSCGRTGGSAIKFHCEENNNTLRLHRPHPQPTLKLYLIDYVIEELTKEGLL